MKSPYVMNRAGDVDRGVNLQALGAEYQPGGQADNQNMRAAGFNDP